MATKKLAKADLVSRGIRKIFAPLRQQADDSGSADHPWLAGRCSRLIFGLNSMRSINASR
jgi:hypothetical protein